MMRRSQRVWVLVVACASLVAGCGDDDGTSDAAGGSDGSGGPPPPCENPRAGEPILWIDTGPIEHDRDYHSFENAVSADVPKDWTCPIDYANGTYQLEVEVLALSNEAAQPIFYTVGWKRPEATSRTDDAEYIRTAVKIDDGVGVYEADGPVKTLQQVIDGKDAGPVEDAWDWTNAWRRPNGDAFHIGPEDPYPLEVAVKVTLIPAE